MNRLALLALTIAAIFLMLMAVLVDSPPLFYMATAVAATLGASRLQAWLAVRGLRLERHAPPAVRVGEVVTIDITVWGERRLKRPLVTVADGFPEDLVTLDLTPSLPVAPSFDQPIRSRYSFRPMRRGRYRWGNLVVSGTDALGLVTLDRAYEVAPMEVTVYPAPIPVSVRLSAAAGWGTSDLERGRIRGAGLDTRGLRQYVPGDPMKHVHWPTSARTGNLVVKEFDAGAGASVMFLIQRTLGSEVGTNDATTLEAMCGHALYLAGQYLRQGALVLFPQLESEEAALMHPEARERAIREVLTDVKADRPDSLAAEIGGFGRLLHAGGTLALMLAVQDPDLPGILAGLAGMQCSCLVYDTRDYADEHRAKRSPASAADPAYIAQLEAAGAAVILMPKVTSLL